MTSAGVRFVDAMGLCSAGKWLRIVYLSQLSLNESSEHVVVIGGLDIGLFDEIWAGRPWGRRSRDFEGLMAIGGCWGPILGRFGLGPFG